MIISALIILAAFSQGHRKHNQKTQLQILQQELIQKSQELNIPTDLNTPISSRQYSNRTTPRPPNHKFPSPQKVAKSLIKIAPILNSFKKTNTPISQKKDAFLTLHQLLQLNNQDLFTVAELLANSSLKTWETYELLEPVIALTSEDDPKRSADFMLQFAKTNLSKDPNTAISFQTTLSTFANIDPVGAAEWIKQQLAKPHHNKIKHEISADSSGILVRLATNHPHLIGRYAVDLGENINDAINTLRKFSNQSAFEATQRILNSSNLSKNDRQTLIHNLGSIGSIENATQWLDWISLQNIPQTTKQKFIQNHFRMWTYQNPSQSLALIRNITDQDLHQTATQTYQKIQSARLKKQED